MLMRVKGGVPIRGNSDSADAELRTHICNDAVGTKDYFDYTATFTTGFSQFILVEQINVVPLKLLSFQAVPVNNKFIKLVWSTENENNISSYAVERTIAGSDNFISVGSVPGLNNSLSNTYQFIDNNVKENVTYQYRLRIVENSNSTYSAIRLAGITGKNLLVNIAPNPSSGIFKINIEGYKGAAGMIVYNALNQVIMSKNATIEYGTSVGVDLSKYPKGIYTLKIQLTDKVVAYKLYIKN